MDNTIDTLQIKINEARDLLSNESRESIDSVNWKLIILGMNKKYNPEQLENLETETELLLCGILNPEDYPKELEKRMQITKEEVSLLIGEMDRLIFKKIQEELEKKITRKEISFANKPFVSDPNFIDLPKGVQEAISRSNWKEDLYKIAQKYKLAISQMGALEEITIKVIKNEIHPNKYESELASRITISKEDLSNLVNDVNENVLKKIREAMRNQDEANEKEGEEKIPLPPYAKKVEAPKVGEPVKTIIVKPKITEVPKSTVEEKPKESAVSTNTVPNQSASKTADPYREAF